MVLIGRLTKDAVVSTLKDDRKVVNFTLAVNDSYKPKGSEEWQNLTTFYNCAYWISPKVAERLRKGSLVEIAGRAYVSAYKDMEGEAKATLHCHVDSIKVHQQMKAGTSKPTEEKKEEANADLPF
ncbi:MAG: single-stranded DNA-binding protein [Ferruginibacter sp.]